MFNVSRYLLCENANFIFIMILFVCILFGSISNFQYNKLVENVLKFMSHFGIC